MVAGGINLNIFPIGKLFRKSGCFFIRRSFHNDILYKLTLEGYLYYLLMRGVPIEFFFEGGRSRTGKLLYPRYGLYQMLLEAHGHLPKGARKELLFIPVSIVHEYLPDQKGLAMELAGKKKKKESTKQLFGLFKLFAYQFGNVHISFGSPISPLPLEGRTLKERTYDLAFECFREVAHQMMVTPTSLIALVMLDDPQGALKWDDLLKRSKAIIDYCKEFDIPLSESLAGGDDGHKGLSRMMDILIANKKMEVLETGEGQRYYSVKEDTRMELLYFKNTILHHFLIPWTIQGAWMKIFKGEIEKLDDLKTFFLRERSLLKHEFYLPTVKEFFQRSQQVISRSIGRQVKSLEDCLQLSKKELYQLASEIGPFARAYSYIHEAYYIGSFVLAHYVQKEGKEHFDLGSYQELFEKFHRQELSHSTLVRYNESYSRPLIQSSFKFFTTQSFVEKHPAGGYFVSDKERLEKLHRSLEEGIRERLTFVIQR